MAEVAVVLPMYNKIEPKTAMNVFQLQQSPHVKSLAVVEGTLVSDARNVGIREAFKHHPSFTHVLFIDADQCYFTCEHLDWLVQADKDIIAGITVRRHAEKDGRRAYTFAPLVDPYGPIRKDAIIESSYTGMFFTLIKREVLEALGEDTPDGKMWFTHDRSLREGFEQECNTLEKQLARDHKRGEITMHDLLEQHRLFCLQARRGADNLGEDIQFCRAARASGFKIFVHTGILLGHIGSNIYTPG